MDRGYEKEVFETIKIKESVAKKFRQFCKRQSKSRSMALLCMLEYFEKNGVSPDDRYDETIASLKYLISRRFNSVIAIIRDIEKNQTKPTIAILEALLGGLDSSGRKTLLLEKTRRKDNFTGSDSKIEDP